MMKRQMKKTGLLTLFGCSAHHVWGRMQRQNLCQEAISSSQRARQKGQTSTTKGGKAPSGSQKKKERCS